MKHRITASAFILTLLSGFGCSTSEYGRPAPFTGTYRERTGQVTSSDLAVRLPRALARNGFLIERVKQHHKDYSFETQWKQRTPFEDEKATGFVAARTRLRLRATWAGRLYVLHFEAENQVRTARGEWVRGPATQKFGNYAKEIGNDIRLEIATGLRRF